MVREVPDPALASRFLFAGSVSALVPALVGSFRDVVPSFAACGFRVEDVVGDARLVCAHVAEVDRGWGRCVDF